MKKLTVTTLIITACLSTNVMAKHYSHNDYARVISVTPVYDYVANRIPVETCRNIDYRHHAPEPKHQSAVPVVVGGVIGGVVGHSIGSNRGDKRIGAIAGTVIGATIGASIEQGGEHHYHGSGNHCTTTYQVDYVQVIVGYDVTYKYRAHRYHTHTKYHPGKRILVPREVHPDRKHKKEHPGRITMSPGHHDKRYQ